jgi:hypothetical protein
LSSPTRAAVDAPLADASRRNRLTGATVVTIASIYLGYGLATAQRTFGCDFLAYFRAATHWLSGTPIYDLSVTSTGTCGTYQYPPPFVLVAVPFSLGGFALGTWLWVAFLLTCWAVGTAILPVRPITRWAVLLFGAIGWPLIYAVRIGEVGPILYLLFAVGWRNLSRARWVGACIAGGNLVNLKPFLL